MLEFIEQTRSLGVKFDAVVFATSSGGTQSGLAIGSKLGGYTGRLLGISVDHRADELVPVLVNLANATARHIGTELSFTAEDFEVNDHYLGGGYAIMGEPEREAIRLCAQTEGLLVDPVYTGRAMAGLIDLIRQGEFRPGQNVLFWHTGGTPALFAYASQLT
jgi:1-aminocyclopropane-1-carboxylate deaminase/D-cysteine desulfhydrase-like pyridoxal-dependent ACC family enzyme